MRKFLTLDLSGIHLPTVALSLAVGWVGGIVAGWLHLPLPMLLGSLVAVATMAMAGLRPLGHLPQFPQAVRQLFIPIIGVSIGGAFQPQIIEEARAWWPSLLALFLAIPVMHFLGYKALRHMSGLDRATLFFGSAPGGLIEVVQMGEEAGADVAMLTMLQFLRLILTIVLVPIAFTLMTGHAVGSAGGVQMTGADVPLQLRDVAILTVCAVVGAYLGVRLRMPAAWISGPILVSGLVHLFEFTKTVPPEWLIALTQVVIGTGLAVRFSGMAPRMVLHALRFAAVNVAIAVGVAIVTAVLLGPVVGEPAAAVFLAFSPGGLTEMSLIALSLQMSVVYVSAHHVARILIAVMVVRLFAGRVLKHGR